MIYLVTEYHHLYQWENIHLASSIPSPTARTTDATEKKPKNTIRAWTNWLLALVNRCCMTETCINETTNDGQIDGNNKYDIN